MENTEKDNRFKRGGLSTKEKHGIEHFKKVGKKGGNATKEKYGPEYYRELNRKSQEAKKRKKKQKKAWDTFY